MDEPPNTASRPSIVDRRYECECECQLSAELCCPTRRDTMLSAPTAHMNKTPSTVSVAGKNGIGGYTWEYATVPDNRSNWEKFKTTIWNPETHQFLGRTGKSWGEFRSTIPSD
ncbi:Sodium/potassium-transporting ATPase subunit beta-2 [Homalodisca vitripennis]|nr:Sodium/potassium-transporting ATPase subunit beta-2 [Homalodisca vitripennis]